MKARKDKLYPSCVYTIAAAQDLDAILKSGGQGEITEGKPWKSAMTMFADAESGGRFLPILFADAAVIDGVRWWAVIDGIELQDDGGTLVSFHNLRRLGSQLPLSNLVLLNTGKKLSERFIRPYALCRTPKLVIKDVLQRPFELAWFSTDDYVRALQEVEPEISKRQRKMLIGHYWANGRRLSGANLSRLAGYASDRAANMQYGKFAGRVAAALGHTPPNELTGTIAEWTSEKDENGHGQWILFEEVARALENLGWVSPKQEAPDASAALREIYAKEPEVAAETPTTREALIDARLGQGRFRQSLVSYWGGCSVTGCTNTSVLIASHIVPWSEGSNLERLDPFNGLLLTPNLDVLFDRYLISFVDDGAILISGRLDAATKDALGVSDRLKLRGLEERHLPYLLRHRARFLREDQE